MLPDILNVGAVQDASVKSYQPRQTADAGMSDRLSTKPEAGRVQDAAKAYAVNGVANRVPGTQKTDQTDPKSKQDQVELQFALTRDEKAAFSRYSASREEGEDNKSAFVSDEDRKRMQEAAERIATAMEEQIAKNNQSRQRVEKAVTEWYSILSGDDRDAKTNPLAFIGILRDAAMGKFDS